MDSAAATPLSRRCLGRAGFTATATANCTILNCFSGDEGGNVRLPEASVCLHFPPHVAAPALRDCGYQNRQSPSIGRLGATGTMCSVVCRRDPQYYGICVPAVHLWTCLSSKLSGLQDIRRRLSTRNISRAFRLKQIRPRN